MTPAQPATTAAFLPTDTLDAATARTLHQQALPFQKTGLDTADRSSNSVHLAGDDTSIRLAYRTRRQLLLRLHQLHVNTIVGSTSGPGEDGTLDLRVQNTRDRTYWWKPRGRGPALPDEITTRLSGPALTQLVRTVDLAGCTVSWTARGRRWHVSLAPYGGHHLRLFLPPITYTNTLTTTEAATITAALHEITHALAAGNETP